MSVQTYRRRHKPGHRTSLTPNEKRELLNWWVETYSTSETSTGREIYRKKVAQGWKESPDLALAAFADMQAATKPKDTTAAIEFTLPTPDPELDKTDDPRADIHEWVEKRRPETWRRIQDWISFNGEAPWFELLERVQSSIERCPLFLRDPERFWTRNAVVAQRYRRGVLEEFERLDNPERGDEAYRAMNRRLLSGKTWNGKRGRSHV